MKRLATILLSATLLAGGAYAVLQAEDKAATAKPAATAAKAAPVKDYLIAEVGGEKIFYHDVEKTWSEIFPGDGAAPPLANFGDAIRENVVRGLVSEKLMLKEAQDKKLDDSAAVQEKLAQIKNQLVVQELLKERNKSVVTDAKVKAKYTELSKQMSGKEEVHASHILVEKEEAAKELYKKVKAGGDFAKIAKEKSADRGSAVKGGDLGYFTKDQMVPEFAEAAFAMKKGEISEPVKSAFGWHIIQLQDRRKLPVPTLEETRPQIEQQLMAEANQAYILDLLKSAKIKYYNPEGKEIPFPAEQKVDAPKQ
jgi:peptidyl-prolyl cis-trans isomerase C